MEYMIEATKFLFTYLDFNTINKDEFWLKERMISRPLGYSEMKADWTNIYDGIFYIHHMSPSIKKE